MDFSKRYLYTIWICDFLVTNVQRVSQQEFRARRLSAKLIVGLYASRVHLRHCSVKSIDPGSRKSPMDLLYSNPR